MDEQALAKKALSEETLAFYVEARTGKKRNYIFDYSKSRSCDHSNLKVIARGGIVYRCSDCNYAFHITGGYQQPLHNEVIMAAFTMLNFSKEFGMHAVGEVLRRPIGQNDGSMHKPVLPEGMSFTDVLDALEAIDVNSEDGGQYQLRALISHVWEGGRPELEAPLGAKQQLEEGDKGDKGDNGRNNNETEGGR